MARYTGPSQFKRRMRIPDAKVWSTQRMGQVLRTTPRATDCLILLHDRKDSSKDPFGRFLVFRALATKSPSKTKNTVAIRKASLHFFETEEILCRHILITVSFIPTLLPVSFAVQPPSETENDKQYHKIEACAKTTFFQRRCV